MTNEIIEKRKMVADFLGWEKSFDKENFYKVPNLYPVFDINHPENTGWTEFHISDCPFDTSYDWLMPVIKKMYNHLEHNKVCPFGYSFCLYVAFKLFNIQDLFDYVAKCIKYFDILEGGCVFKE